MEINDRLILNYFSSYFIVTKITAIITIILLLDSPSGCLHVLYRE